MSEAIRSWLAGLSKAQRRDVERRVAEYTADGATREGALALVWWGEVCRG